MHEKYKHSLQILSDVPWIRFGETLKNNFSSARQRREALCGKKGEIKLKKQLKALLIAGILAGITIQPVYGAGITAGQPSSSIRFYQPSQEEISNGPGAVQQAEQEFNDAQEKAQAEAEAAAKAALSSASKTALAAFSSAVSGTAVQTAIEAQAQAEALAAARASYIQPGAVRVLDPAKPMIALTYDDGPQSSVGNRIMNVFNQYGGKCTFFLVGERVPSHAAEVQRMANEGFEVANHTQNHKYLNRLGAAEIRAQVEACNNTIESICGVRPTLMRLPGGNKNATVLANVAMPVILWNIDTRDWKTRNAQSTVNAVLGKVKDGDIILMHELYPATADATDILVPALVSQGFQLVTVSELAYYRGASLTPGQIYNRIP